MKWYQKLVLGGAAALIFLLGGRTLAQSYNPQDSTRLAILQGTVMDENDQPQDSIEVTKIQTTPTIDSTTVMTGPDGKYSFPIKGVIITGIQDEKQTETIGKIKYIPNNPQLQLNLEKYSTIETYISDAIGQTTTIENKELEAGTHNINIEKIRNYANGVYIIATIIDGQMYANKISKIDKNTYSWGATGNKENQLEKILTTTKQNKKTLQKPQTEANIIIKYVDLKNKHYNYKIDS